MENMANQGLNTEQSKDENFLDPEQEKWNLELRIQELEAELKEKKEILKNLRIFFPILSHDLKTPFQVISGYIGLLHKDHTLIEKKDFIETLDNNSKRFSNLLKNLMDWGVAQQESSKPYIESIDVKSEIENIFSVLYELAKEKEINLELELKGEINLNFDKNQFNTIFRNLISNAIRFSNEKGKVLVSIEQKGDLIYFSVKDNGVGIKDKEKIFKQGEKTKDTKGIQSSGLGLSFCKDIIEKMGGSIGVESEIGKGSEFIVTLPISPKA